MPRIVEPSGWQRVAGARAMLLSQEARTAAETTAANIEHAKPNEREPDFAYIVAEKMYF